LEYLGLTFSHRRLKAVAYLNSLKIGCLSWTYPDWVGPFYKEGTKPSDFLELYSQAFDIVEVDSTFYRTPTSDTVRQWVEKTPEDFVFTTKLPRKISHSAKGADTSKEFAYFQSVVRNFGAKLGCIIGQMPPHFKFETGIERLKQLLSQIDPKLRLAIELRHKSWYNDETYKLLRDNKVSLVWAVNEYVEQNIKPIATTDFVYLRFRGEFNEFKKFNRVQKQKTEVLRLWWENLSPLLERMEIKKAFVLLSNHFEGFAPTTANSFREIAGLQAIDWKEKMMSSQPSLGSYQA
jgi:uncharacterized protein YecE (DUF72 family)